MKPRIRVFSNRIEFFNPGALPKPYEELQKGDISLPRNPLVTKMFRIIDLCENAGFGFDKMINGWLSHYPHKPEITGGLDYYKISFYNNLDKIKSSEKNSEKSSEKIIKLISNNPEISALNISKELDISSRAVEKQIHKLKEKGKLKRIGSDKGGHWEIIK